MQQKLLIVDDEAQFECLSNKHWKNLKTMMLEFLLLKW